MKGFSSGNAGEALIWKALQLGAARAISFLQTLVLARLLVPEDFGVVAVATVSVGFVLRMTDLGLYPALIQRDGIGERDYNAAWTVDICRAVALAVALMAAAPLIGAAFRAPWATALVRVFAWRAVLESSASIKTVSLIRQLRFRDLAWINIPAALIEAGVAIASAPRLGAWAIVVGALAGSAVKVAVSYIVAPHRPRLVFELSAIAPLIAYGRWVLLAGLAAIAGSSALQLAVSRQFGAAALGLYVMAVKVASLPNIIAGEIVADVAFPLYAGAQADRPRVTRIFKGNLTGIAALLLPVYALLIALAPSLVRNILGAQWEGTAALIRILAAVGAVGLFGDALIPLLKGLGHPYKVTVLEGVQSLAIAVAVWPLSVLGGVADATASWIPAILASCACSLVFAYRMLGRYFAGLGKTAVAVLLSTIACGVVAGATVSHLPGLDGLIIGTVMAGFAWWLALRGLDARFHLGLRDGFLAFFTEKPQLSEH